MTGTNIKPYARRGPYARKEGQGMKTKLVLVLKVEVQVDEDDNRHGAQVTLASADDPQKRSTRQFESIAHAFDDIFNNLLTMKMQEIAEHQQIHGQAGNA